MRIKIIYEDSYILIVDKPAGVIVNRSDTTKAGETLQDWIERRYLRSAVGSLTDFKKRGGIVHRLDKGTSGVLIIAKTEDAFKNLQAQFKKRLVGKEYLALVWGVIKCETYRDGYSENDMNSESRLIPQDNTFTIDAPIARNPKNRTKFAIVNGGRPAVTEFAVEGLYRRYSLSNETSHRGISEDLNEDSSNYFTLLRCFPKTGRTHQIRVHLTALNHPIVGDNLYSGRKRMRRSRELTERMFLHASKISFSHPKEGSKVSFQSELPQELKDTLAKLKGIE